MEHIIERHNMSSDERQPKRADQRSRLTILVLGDEGVGKSSLISTFVSRYFSEVVPEIMTRVRLPPDPYNSCITTIVDSKGADAALISKVATMSLSPSSSSDSLKAILERAATGKPVAASGESTAGIDNVDSIVLVYDLDRTETFFRLENHWLPLIERCYNGQIPVIIAENKMDLFRPSSSAGAVDEQVLARKRQQLVSLMQRYPFVRQCIKCSAKNLLRIDDIFLKAQQAVLYPFTPALYDLEHGRLAVECKRALTRIFRMYDEDRDNLLSDVELNNFQRDTYHVPIFDRDLSAWKKVVSRNNPSNEVVVKDGKFTLAGFFIIFDVFITQNRLDVVWQALRRFHYDDDLHLHVPDEVMTPPGTADWRLSVAARRFLKEIFCQFDSDKDGVLSVDDLVAIFSVLPPPGLPPWHPVRSIELFRRCFSHPKYESLHGALVADSSRYSESLIVPEGLSQSLSNSGISLFSSLDSLPSVDVGSVYPISKPLSFLDWMSYWHLMFGVSPPIARAELFRLGHTDQDKVERNRRPRSKSEQSSNFIPDDAKIPSREIRVLVLGSHSCGKSELLNRLCSSSDLRSKLKASNSPESSSTYLKLCQKGTEKEIAVHFVFTDVPESAAASQQEHYRQLSELFGSTASPKDRICDLAVLAFDCTKTSSFLYAKELEAKLLTEETPRVFVATKSDLRRAPEPEEGDIHPSDSIDIATIHCRESELEPPIISSSRSLGEDERREILSHFAGSAIEIPGFVAKLRSKPYEDRQRREAAQRRKILWLGGIVTVSVVMAVSVGLMWRGSKINGNRERKGGLNWFRSLFRVSTEPSTGAS